MFSLRRPKRRTSIFIITILPLLALTVIPTAPVHAQAVESTLHKVLKRGIVVIGTRSTTPGFGFKNEKGELVGFDIDVAREIANGLFDDPSKVRFEILPSGADRVPALVAGRVDAVVSQFSVFIKRAAAVEFSLPYVNANYAAMVKADSPYQKNKDLNGKVVSQRNAEETKKLILAQIPQAKVQGFKENSEAFLALRQGRVEAFFNDDAAGYYIMRKFPGQFRIIIDPENILDTNQSSIGVKQGDQIWLNYLNWALVRMKLTGKLQRMHKKWFDTEELEPAWVRTVY